MADDIVERLLDEHFEQVRREGEEDADDRAALARDALARIQHLETYAEECRRAYELSEAKFREAGKLVDRLRAALDRIACFDTVDVSLWNAKAMRDFARAALAGDAKHEVVRLGDGATYCPGCTVTFPVEIGPVVAGSGENIAGTFTVGPVVPAEAAPNIAESNDRADAAPLDEGPWYVVSDRVSGDAVGVGSDDFKRDVLLRVDGDFGCGVEKTDYCAWLARTLNQLGGRAHCPHCGQWHDPKLGC